MTRDPDLLASSFMTNIAFLSNSWNHLLGRPTITLLATNTLLGNHAQFKFQNFIKEIKKGITTITQTECNSMLSISNVHHKISSFFMKLYTFFFFFL